MSSELKTLKDIADFDCQDCGYSVKELRQEAIKSIKNMEEYLHNKKLGGLYNQEEKRIGICATQEWIKLFFNLTEEDLK